LYCISVIVSSSRPSRWPVIRRACPSTRPARSTTPSSEARRPAGKTQRASEARALYPSIREETTPRAPRQRRTSPLRANQKSTNHHYSSLEDSVPGFRIEPPSDAAHRRRLRADVVQQERPTGGPVRVQLRQGVRVSPHLAAVLRAVPGHRPASESSSAATNANSRYNRLDVAEPANAVSHPGSPTTPRTLA